MVQDKSSVIKDFFGKKGQIKSYIFMIFSCLAWVSGYVFANQHNFNPVETNFSRSIVMTIGSYYLCRMLNLNIEYKSEKSWNILLKRHASFVFVSLIFAGVQFFMPLGVVHTLGSCSPIFTLVLQRLLRKNEVNHITDSKIKGCFIAVIGIILTSNGKYIYSYLNEDFQFKSQFHNYVSSNYTVMITATIILLCSLVLGAYGVLITQQAKCHSFQIVFHFAVSNLIFSSISYIFLTEKRPASEMYESLIWVGGFLCFSQIAFTLSLNLSENFALTNVTNFFNVVVGYGIGVLRYGEKIDVISLIGTGLVIGGVGIVILTKKQHENDTTSDSSKKQINLNQVDKIKVKTMDF